MLSSITCKLPGVSNGMVNVFAIIRKSNRNTQIYSVKNIALNY